MSDPSPLSFPQLRERLLDRLIPMLALVYLPAVVLTTARSLSLGWTLNSTRHDLAKAILEGLTFELLVNLNTMEQAGIRVNELVAAGGGAKSPRWLQLKADILNRPIRTLQCGEAACLGAALLAGTAAGCYASVEEGVRACVRLARVYMPSATSAERYAARFSSYTKLYPALKSFGFAL